jgi:hypothetical protein
LTVLRIQAMNVWTAVNSNATGNEISAPPDTRHNWLSLRRLGGQLAGRLDPEPALLSGDGGVRSTLQYAHELSPIVSMDRTSVLASSGAILPAPTVSFEPPALQH